MTKFRDHLEKAREIKTDATHWYTGFSREMRSEIGNASLDLDLSAEGRQKAAGKVRTIAGLTLLRKAHQYKQQYLKELNAAKAEAEKTIKQQIVKPDQDKIDQFTTKLGRLKTSLMLSTRKETAEKLLDEFVSRIDDPYFASLLANQFGEIATNVISATGGDKSTKLKLSQTFTKLQNDSASDEVKDALQVNEAAGNLIDDGNIFPFVAQQNADDLLGKQVAIAMNKPEEFFTEDKEKYAAQPDGDYRLHRTEADEYFRETGEQDLNDQLAGRLTL
jgi:hypothetical protein